MLQLLLPDDQQEFRQAANLEALRHVRRRWLQQVQPDALRRSPAQWCHLSPNIHRRGGRENKQVSTFILLCRLA
jgi:hypothetical protein